MPGLTHLKPKAHPTGPLTTQGPNPAHNRQREPSQMTGVKAKTAQPQGTGNREHCTAGHYRISSSKDHYFQEQETADFHNINKQIQRARQNGEAENYVPNERTDKTTTKELNEAEKSKMPDKKF